MCNIITGYTFSKVVTKSNQIVLEEKWDHFGSGTYIIHLRVFAEISQLFKYKATVFAFSNQIRYRVVGIITKVLNKVIVVLPKTVSFYFFNLAICIMFFFI